MSTPAASRLPPQENGWGRVWDRFARSGRGMYEPAAAVLGPIDPPDLLSANAAIYASANARQECALRAALAKLKDAGEATARDLVARLTKEHADCCEGSWAARGQARLAEAVQHLARLTIIPPLPAQDAEALADTYAETGWEADNAALCALEAVAPRQEADAIATLQEDREAVVAALRTLYAPRLQREALALQALLPAGPPPSQKPAESDAVLFIDGLRMDVAQRLASLLRQQGAVVDFGWRWTGLPNVTATCKPLASPAAARLHGAETAEWFEPLAPDGKRATHAVLMREFATLGCRTEATLVPTDKCWIEAGQFDEGDHEQQSRMADGIGAALSAVAAAAPRLVRAGQRLRIATDHGWLLLPGGLPVASLPAGLIDRKEIWCTSSAASFRCRGGSGSHAPTARVPAPGMSRTP